MIDSGRSIAYMAGAMFCAGLFLLCSSAPAQDAAVRCGPLLILHINGAF